MLVICLQVAIVVLGLRQFEDSPVEEELTLNCACEREVLRLLDQSLNVSAVVEHSQFCSSLNSSLNSSRTETEVGAHSGGCFVHVCVCACACVCACVCAGECASIEHPWW